MGRGTWADKKLCLPTMTPAELTRWLGTPRVLDGAMGSELLRRGVESAAVLWGVGALLSAPERVRDVHRDHASAGAEALTAATFRVAPYSLRRHGLGERAGELATRAMACAREGADQAQRKVVILASQTTLEDCYRPDLVPADSTLAREHAATAALLAASGADALLLETFNTVREAAVASAAAATTGLPVLVCFACRSEGRLLSGEDVGVAAAAVSAVPGVVAVGVNCTAVGDTLPALVRIFKTSRLPLVAYANDAWYAQDSRWLAAQPVTPDRYAAAALAWVSAGARLVGGCCGTTPAHIAALAAALSSE
jgi:S-methylmethionine-dependent homocysteine/selenocysteine methylase